MIFKEIFISYFQNWPLGRAFFLSIVSFFLIVSVSFSQTPYAQNFTFYQGNSFRSVHSLLEDRSGFIWFTSDEGLFRYDGTSFKLFNRSNQNSTAGTYIKEDALGRIWYQSFDGAIYFLENNKLNHIKTQSTPRLFPIQTTLKHLFVSEKNHFVIYDLKTLKIVKKIPKKTENIYTSAILKEEFYYVHDNFLWKIDKDLKDKKVAQIPLALISYPLICASKDAIYFTQKSARENLILKFKNNKVETIAEIEAAFFVQNIQFLGNKLFVTTTDGVLIYNPISKKREKTYFSKKSFSAALLDRKSNLWISSPNEGLFLVPNGELSKLDNLKLLPVRLAKGNKELFYTTKNAEVVTLDLKTLEQTSLRKSAINAEGYLLQYFQENQLLVSGFSDGNTYLDVLENPKTSHKIPVSFKKFVSIDHKYYATIGTGLVCFFVLPGKDKLVSEFDQYILTLRKENLDGITFYRLFQPEFQTRGKSMVYDSIHKTLYLATSEGLFTWKNGQVKELFIDKAPVILKSLFIFNGKVLGLSGAKSLLKISSFTKSENKRFESLFQQKVFKVLLMDNLLFVQTRGGLSIYKTNSNQDIILTKKLDISNIEILDFVYDKKFVWIATNDGLLQWNILKNDKAEKLGTFRVNEFLVNDLNFPIKNKTFNYKQNNVSIAYSVLDFGVKTLERVEYKLNEKAWRTLDLDAQTLNFSSLSPNQFLIQFRGIVGAKTVYFENVRFTIAPPFWSTWWFRVLLLAFVALLFYWYYRYQISLLIEKNKLINEKITLENNLNKSLITALKVQMNPHFFYNSLNSIQGLVLSGDREKASESIGLFSDLSRSILESSRNNEINLHDEIELLESYLKLEQMRMPKIKYELKVQENLRLYDLYLPPMILQPIVENSVKHGLANKDMGGTIILTFQLKHNDLLVTIDDDGIGREASMKMNKFVERKGSSFSTEANINRIELLNESLNLNITQVISDKMDENNEATGTLVSLSIPQNEY